MRVAYDGVEGADAAASFGPEVALLDIGLPRLNGLDLAREIRGQGGAGVLMVAVTGLGTEDDCERSRAAGFDHHLTKPLAIDELHRLVAARAAAAQ